MSGKLECNFWMLFRPYTFFILFFLPLLHFHSRHTYWINGNYIILGRMDVVTHTANSGKSKKKKKRPVFLWFHLSYWEYFLCSYKKVTYCWKGDQWTATICMFSICCTHPNYKITRTTWTQLFQATVVLSLHASMNNYIYLFSHTHITNLERDL